MCLQIRFSAMNLLSWNRFFDTWLANTASHGAVTLAGRYGSSGTFIRSLQEARLVSAQYVSAACTTTLFIRSFIDCCCCCCHGSFPHQSKGLGLLSAGNPSAKGFPCRIQQVSRQRERILAEARAARLQRCVREQLHGPKCTYCTQCRVVSHWFCVLRPEPCHGAFVTTASVKVIPAISYNKRN